MSLPLLLGLLLSARPAVAQAPTPSDDEVNRIAHQLYCPVCENTPLDVCPTEACRQWRDLIRQQLEQGWTADQIKQYFAAQYGIRVLAEPPRAGINWLAYILPPVAILAGALLLFRAMRTWRRSAASEAKATEPEAEAPKDEYVRRLEEELKRRS